MPKIIVYGAQWCPDCRHGAIAQVAAATGEGVVASYGVREYLKG